MDFGYRNVPGLMSRNGFFLKETTKLNKTPMEWGGLEKWKYRFRKPIAITG